MYGKFVSWLSFVFILICSQSSFAAWIKLQVKNDQAMVYSAPNFDSQVLSYLPESIVFNVDENPLNGFFYKIEYAPKKFGFIVDTDLVLKKSKTAAANNNAKKIAPKTKKKSKRLAFDSTRYLGFGYINMSYKESALGKVRPSALPFYSLKISGPDTLFGGPIDTDFNILISKTMPDYYKKQTGHAATGTILIFDFALYTGAPIGRDIFIYYGLGPMLKYSKIYSEVNNQIKGHQVTDIGLMFPLGVAFRVGKFAIKPEAVYYYEKKQYSSAGLSLQMEF